MNRAQLSCLTALLCLTASSTSHAMVSDAVFALLATSKQTACLPDRSEFVDDVVAHGNIVGDWVSVTAGPGAACELSSSPNDNQAIDILGSHGNFYAVSYQWGGKDYYGWVAKQNVRVGKKMVSVAASAETNTSTMVGTTSTTTACGQPFTTESLNERGVVSIVYGRLNVRSGPSTNCRILDTLVRDSVVHVIGRSDNNWLEINYDSSATGVTIRGWVSGDYIN